MLKIYTRNTCQYCSSAKAVLTNKGITYEEVNVDKDPTAREWLMEKGHRSVPQLYIGETLFVEGGFQGLTKLSDEEINERLGETDVSE
jgi:glutaredoxin 3|tara:strand:- start:351 stop:614 length:264 start_codon:yes stop_codon:yes gene_type:complete